MVWALWVWSIVGVVALPWLSLLAMRTLRKEPEYQYVSSSSPEWSRAVIEDKTLEAARELMARSMGTAWSVGLYSALAATVKQLEFEALSTDAGGLLARCRGGSESADLGCALKGVLALTLLAGCMALAVTCGAILAMGCASRVLARGNLSPLVVEMMLMIRSNLYYSVAYSWTTTLGLLWFAPYELGPVADNALTPKATWDTSVRGAFAAMRAATLVALFCHVALNDAILKEPPRDDDVESTAAAPWTTCARLVVFKACAVTVAIAGNDAAQGVLANFEQASSLSPKSFDFSLTVSGFAYGFVLLALGALCFACLSPNMRRRRERRPLFRREPNENKNRRGPRFARLVFTWLVIFATWSPWKRLLIAVYSYLGQAVGPVVLLPFQILLALAFSLSLAFAQVLIDKILKVCCCVLYNSFDDDDDDDDEYYDDFEERDEFVDDTTPLHRPSRIPLEEDEDLKEEDDDASSNENP